MACDRGLYAVADMPVGGFFAFFLFFCLHLPSLRLIFIDLQFTTTKAKTGNLAAGAEIYANGRVRLQTCGQGITVPVDAICTSGR